MCVTAALFPTRESSRTTSLRSPARTPPVPRGLGPGLRGRLGGRFQPTSDRLLRPRSGPPSHRGPGLTGCRWPLRDSLGLPFRAGCRLCPSGTSGVWSELCGRRSPVQGPLPGRVGTGGGRARGPRDSGLPAYPLSPRPPREAQRGGGDGRVPALTSSAVSLTPRPVWRQRQEGSNGLGLAPHSRAEPRGRRGTSAGPHWARGTGRPGLGSWFPIFPRSRRPPPSVPRGRTRVLLRRLCVWKGAASSASS